MRYFHAPLPERMRKRAHALHRIAAHRREHARGGRVRVEVQWHIWRDLCSTAQPSQHIVAQRRPRRRQARDEGAVGCGPGGSRGVEGGQAPPPPTFFRLAFLIVLDR